MKSNSCFDFLQPSENVKPILAHSLDLACRLQFAALTFRVPVVQRTIRHSIVLADDDK